MGQFSFFTPCCLFLGSFLLKYSSTFSTGVSSFFLVSLGVFFWVGVLQDLEGPFSFGSGLENGIGEFVTPLGTTV